MYYGFVESIERLVSPKRAVGDEPDYLATLRRHRHELGLPEPTHQVWLDCIESSYFDDELGWPKEPIDPDNEDAREERRTQILGLNRSRMTAIFLPLSERDIREMMFIEVLRRENWRRVKIGTEKGAPALIGADFDAVAEDGGLTFVRSILTLRSEKTDELHSVFNVDFLPGIDSDGEIDGEPGEPLPRDFPPDHSKQGLYTTEYMRYLSEQQEKRKKSVPASQEQVWEQTYKDEG